jgi:hypothetical protein
MIMAVMLARRRKRLSASARRRATFAAAEPDGAEPRLAAYVKDDVDGDVGGRRRAAARQRWQTPPLRPPFSQTGPAEKAAQPADPQADLVTMASRVC